VKALPPEPILFARAVSRTRRRTLRRNETRFPCPACTQDATAAGGVDLSLPRHTAKAGACAQTLPSRAVPCSVLSNIVRSSSTLRRLCGHSMQRAQSVRTGKERPQTTCPVSTGRGTRRVQSVREGRACTARRVDLGVAEELAQRAPVLRRRARRPVRGRRVVGLRDQTLSCATKPSVARHELRDQTLHKCGVRRGAASQTDRAPLAAQSARAKEYNILYFKIS